MATIRVTISYKWVFSCWSPWQWLVLITISFIVIEKLIIIEIRSISWFESRHVLVIGMRAEDRGSLLSIDIWGLPTLLRCHLGVSIHITQAFKFAWVSGALETAIRVSWIQQVIGDLNFIFLLFFSELVHSCVICLRCKFQTMLSLSFVSIEKSWMFIEIPINLLDLWDFPLKVYFRTFFSFCKHFILSVICKFVAHIIYFILNFISCSNVMIVYFIAVEFLPSFGLSGY